MNEAIRKATEELEALACALERQAIAWDKEVPSAAARVRALALHVAALDQPAGGRRSLPSAAAAWKERGWQVVSLEPQPVAEGLWAAADAACLWTAAEREYFTRAGLEPWPLPM
jgi:hypothetical protein